MQIVGLVLLAFVVWFGFNERTDMTISAFDVHAAVVVGHRRDVRVQEGPRVLEEEADL